MAGVSADPVHPLAALDYAAAFGPDVHRPFAVTAWGTAVGLRPIPGTPYEDAAGCYPLMPMAPDADLDGGLEELASAGAVSFVAVTDPHHALPVGDLAARFAVCRPFKTHFVIDRAIGPLRFSKHHRYEVRRAERACTVRTAPLAEVCDLWCALYATVIARHGITGAARFSARFFKALSLQRGCLAFLAEAEGETVGASLWLRHGDVAYYFLNASSEEGYVKGAAYALMSAACSHFGDCRWINLGGVAGAHDDLARGLARFKKGFANATADSHLIGAVLNPDLYAMLTGNRPDRGWFPAYRG